MASDFEQYVVIVAIIVAVAIFVGSRIFMAFRK